MDIVGLIEQIESLNYPVAYQEFLEEQTFPFIIIDNDNTDSFNADNKTLVELIDVEIQLYSPQRNFAVEKELKELLNKLDIPFSHTGTYIDSEEMYQRVFTVRLIQKL